MTTRSFGVRIYEHEQCGRFEDFEGEVEIWRVGDQQRIGLSEQVVGKSAHALRISCHSLTRRIRT